MNIFVSDHPLSYPFLVCWLEPFRALQFIGQIGDFRVLKPFKLERFRELKFYMFESFRGQHFLARFEILRAQKYQNYMAQKPRKYRYIIHIPKNLLKLVYF